MSDKCPWPTAPKTLEAMLHSIAMQTEWEKANYKKAPIAWCLIPTKEMFSDLIQRLLDVEKRDNNE